MVTLVFAVKLFWSQPEKDENDALAYGSAIAAAPVVIPLVAVMPLLPDMPPTTRTERAESVAFPETESADPLVELSFRLQFLRTTCELPWTLVAPLALESRASTQPAPPFPTATARPVMATGCELNIADTKRGCWRVTLTSTAPEVVV